MKVIESFKKKLEATKPGKFAWSACLIGLGCLAFTGFYFFARERSIGAKMESQDTLERFQALWVHYTSIPQGMLGLGLTLLGGGMAFRKEWGRRGLIATMRVVFLSLFILMPAMALIFFVFQRDKWIPAARGAGPGGLVFAYGTAALFGIWTVVVAVSMFWWVALLARRLNDPDYRAWTSKSKEG